MQSGEVCLRGQHQPNSDPHYCRHDRNPEQIKVEHKITYSSRLCHVTRAIVISPQSKLRYYHYPTRSQRAQTAIGTAEDHFGVYTIPNISPYAESIVPERKFCWVWDWVVRIHPWEARFRRAIAEHIPKCVHLKDRNKVDRERKVGKLFHTLITITHHIIDTK